MNKKALVTGVNSQVNRILLEKLVKMKYDVVAHYHSDNELTIKLKKDFPNVKFLQSDFTDKKSINGFIEEAKENGKYDVVVNAAVTYNGAFNRWEDNLKSWDIWVDNLSVNIIVPGIIMGNANNLMNDDGVIINISSVVGETKFGEQQFLIYSASKSALNSMTATYAKQLSPKIRVVGLAPAYVRSAWNENFTEDESKDLLKAHLTRKYIKPSEIADLMESVINNRSINATTILIDGGYSAPII